jgi:hypothetical protein
MFKMNKTQKKVEVIKVVKVSKKTHGAIGNAWEFSYARIKLPR